MRTRFVLLVAATTMAVFAFACGGDDDDNTIETDGGEVTTSDDLPDDWPDSFPVYDGADLLGTATGESEGISGTVATWETEDSVDDVKEFYDTELADDPWSTDSSSTVSGDSAFWLASNADDDTQAYVLVSGDGDATTIVATVGDLGAELQTPITGSDDDGSDDGSDDSSDDDSDDGGGASLPEEEDLPSDFPEDRVPLPDNAHVVDAGSTSAGGVNSTFVGFYSETSIDDLADSLDSDLKDKGWEETIRTESDGDVFLSYSMGDGSETLVVTITEGDVEGYSRVDVAVTTLTEQ